MGDSWIRKSIRQIVPRGVRNVVRHPGMAFRVGWDEARYTLIGTVNCQVTSDWSVRVHPRTAITFRTSAVDPELRDELLGFMAQCRPGMVLLDVGSHFGMFALAALHAGGSTAQVWAVEPSRACRRLLGLNMQSNGVASQVTVVAKAIGEVDGALPMLTTGAGGYDFLVATDEVRPDSTQIAMTTLPTLAATIPVPITHIKIDIEGFEYEALAGGCDYLRANRPALFLELHGDILRARGKDPIALMSVLADCGYETIEHRGRVITVSEAARMPLARLVCLPSGWAISSPSEGPP